jgi:hypothetical protein
VLTGTQEPYGREGMRRGGTCFSAHNLLEANATYPCEPVRLGGDGWFAVRNHGCREGFGRKPG